MFKQIDCGRIPAQYLTDFYKTGHIYQYPKGTSVVYSNLTARTSLVNGINSVVFFGLQYFIKDILIDLFHSTFFSQPKEKVLKDYKRIMDCTLGEGAVGTSHLAELHDLGYLPIEIKAVDEGTIVPIKVPMLTIVNTKPEFFWVTNFLETIMSAYLWMPITSATTAFQYRKILSEYARRTSSIEDFVQWQGHDFSFRGLVGDTAPLMSGAAHLLSFTGTDTLPAILFLEKIYGADVTKELVGGSVAATEHSVMCMGTEESEEKTFVRLLTEVYHKGIVSVVSDTWDFFKVLTETLPNIKDIIMGRDGKLVVRPDSGDPVKIICGDEDAPAGSPERKGAVQLLWEVFGGTTNTKGYKELDPHIGLIYGDSITLERCEAICAGLEKNGFASTNVVLGIGSYTYQYVTRDTFGMAVKSTYGEINGKPVNIYKNPKTDSGNFKKSAKGLIKVFRDNNGNIAFKDECTKEEESTGMLTTIFKDGVLKKEHTLSEIRKRLLSSL